MYNYLLKGLIEDFKKQDMTAFEIIYEEFKGLIAFYSRKLNDADAFSELTLYFIEILYKIELSKFRKDKTDSLKRYIAVALRNRYIAISKKQSERHQNELNILENDSCCVGFEALIETLDTLKYLTKSQRTIIIYKYIFSLSDFQIAEMLGTTRQAVNRLKNRALETLKKYYEL